MTGSSAFARFLRETSVITRRAALVIGEQTKGSGGFLYEEAELKSTRGVTVAFGESGERPMVEIVRPSEPPVRPAPEPKIPDLVEASSEEFEAYDREKAEYDTAVDVYKKKRCDYDRHVDLYQRVFAARNESEGKELIVGIVNLRSGSEQKLKVDRPISLLEVLVELEENSGTLRVVPASPMKLELGWLPQDLPKFFRNVSEQTEALLSTDRAEILEAIAELVNVLGLDFTDGDEEHCKFTIQFRFVLAYRKQTTNAIMDVMDGMIEAFDGGDPPTAAYRKLLSPDLEVRFNEKPNKFGSLPLPASSVQEKIVRHALSNPLTVVLGPPGTGKTHTIANTAAALIGRGKRVLVTSERELPLLEVQDKLPETMQALLLPIFGRDNVAALTKSATAIVERRSNDVSQQSRKKKISELEQQVRELSEKQMSLQQQLCEAAGLDAKRVAVWGTEFPLKDWTAKLAKDHRTALLKPGGLLAGGGHLSTSDAEAFLDQHSSLAEDHLEHAEFNFPLSLSELTDAATLCTRITDLRHALAKCGPLVGQDLSALMDHTDRIARIARKLASLSLPVESIDSLASSAKLEVISRSASDIFAVGADGPDLEDQAALIREGFNRANKAWDLLESDLTGYLEHYTVDTTKNQYPHLTTVIDHARQLEFRQPPFNNVVEIDGGPSRTRLLRKAEKLRGFLLGGGKFKKWYGIPAEIKLAAEVLGSVRVDGEEVSSLDMLELVIDQLQADTDMENAYRWACDNGFKGPKAHVPNWSKSVGNLPTKARELRTILRSLFADSSEWQRLGAKKTLQGQINSLEPYVDQAIEPAGTCNDKQLDQAKAHLDFAVGCLPDSWKDVARPGEQISVGVISGALEISAEIRELTPYEPAELSPASLESFVQKIKNDSNRREIRMELDQVLASAKLPLQELTQKSPSVRLALGALASEDIEGYESAWANLVTEHTFWLAGTRYHRTRAAVADAFPALAEAVQSSDTGLCQQAKDVLRNIKEHQDFRDGYEVIMEARDSVPNANQLNQQVQTLITMLRARETELAEARCWDAALSRFEAYPMSLSGLNSMIIASQQVPKTKTAKAYPMRLAALQNALKRALPGLPGVVMKMEKCAELIGLPKSEDKKFDVVIVDEASQSLFTSLFVFGLADRVIIVGDNYQTSPRIPFGSSVGLQMTELALKFIPDHPNKDSFSADFSLFDAAFAMSKPLVMTEHFRCDPEIMKISNTLCYEPNGYTLKAMKAPDPDIPSPVNLYHLKDGFVDPEGINRVEAEAVIENTLKIVKEQPDSTIGIVVAGTNTTPQIQYLQKELLGKLGAEEHARRKLEIGTATAFQGSERDVILLSLVNSVTEEAPVLARKPLEWTGQNRYFVQDLNVAVSRAKSQLNIFHSFSLQQIKEGDVRAILLGADKSRPREVDDKVELEKCDSQFEKDVFIAVRDRIPGARMRTQVAAGGYKIDLVVELDGRRIAIECDGDRWHTSPKHVASDLKRQHLLESLGWSFVRFLACQWYSPRSADYWINKIEESLNDCVTHRDH